MDDDETIRILRTIQRKLGRVVRPYYGTTPGDAVLTCRPSERSV